MTHCDETLSLARDCGKIEGNDLIVMRLLSFLSMARGYMTSNIYTRAVMPSGKLVLQVGTNAPILEETILPPCKTTTLLLNRSHALHSLTMEMCTALYNRLRFIDRHTNLTCVILRSTGPRGRAFCAGGDVRAMHEVGSVQHNYELIDRFFRAEYRLNSLLASLRRVGVVSILDGIVMGGGVGLSVHGRWRVATENSIFAMPECAIGLHPDVGASKFLSHLQYPGLGTFLAVTGARLTGRELVATGIATHFVESHALPSLIEKLTSRDLRDNTDIGDILTAHESKKGSLQEALPPSINVIEKCFTQTSIQDTIAKLKETAANEQSEEDAKFARGALEMIRAGSPMSVKLAWDMIHRASSLTIDECLKIEFRLTARLIRRKDFYVGVRSALITKDKNPKWEPDSLDDISLHDVACMFESFDKDLGIDELQLDHSETDLRSRL